MTPLYHSAVERWQARQELYDGPSGMNYLPTFVPLFAPFHALPLRLADVLWRATAMGGLAAGLAGFLRREPEVDFPRKFALSTALALPICLGALSNGQANAHLGAALLLGSWCLATQRWWVAAVCLALAVALKPLGIAAVGLAFLAYPRLWWRLGICTGAVLGLPFLIAPSAYVKGQYQAAFQNLRQCSEVTEHRFADLNGLLRTFGTPLAGEASLVVRALAGLAMGTLCLSLVRKLDPKRRALAWLAFSAIYLMLFNPMTEANSYVMFAPVAVLWLWELAGQNRITWVWGIVGMLVTMSLLPTLLRPWLENGFPLAWDPAMALTLLGMIVWVLVTEAKNGGRVMRELKRET